MTNSKQKGARGERELSSKLKEHGFSTRRGQQYCGANGDADVIGGGCFEEDITPVNDGDMPF